MTENPNCPFCDDPEIIIENELAFAHYDTYPVSNGHCLVITRRHVAEYFQATAAEKLAIWELVDQVKPIIDRDFKPDGYNVGVNIGAAAGQSIPHLHIHVIPRYAGDVENPQGGVRGVIPHKQKYVRKVRSSRGQSQVPEQQPGSESSARVALWHLTLTPFTMTPFTKGAKNRVKTRRTPRR